MEMPKKRTWTLIRIIISVLLVAYLLWQAQPGAVWRVWQGINGWLLALALLLQLAGVALSAYKWGVLLAARGHVLPFGWLFRVYVMGQFANNFLPTTIGGDALRVARLGKRIGDYSVAGASVFLERLTGFLALSVIALGALGATLLPGSAVRTAPWLQLVTAGFGVAALLALAACFLLPTLLARFIHWLPHNAQAPLQRIARDVAEYTPRGTQLAWVVGLSFGFQLLWVLIHAVCAVALLLSVPFVITALMVPLTDMLGLVPIFFNGLGVREVVFSTYLAQIGLGSDAAIGLALLAFSVRLVVSLLGGAALAAGDATLPAAAK